MSRLSIKMRVTIWYTAFMVIVLAMLMAAVFAVSRSAIGSSIRGQLTSMIANNSEELDYDDGLLEVDDDFLFYYDGVYSFVYDGDGRLLFGNAVNSLPVDEVLLAGELRSLRRDGRTYYIYDQRVDDDKHGSAWVRGILDAEASYGVVDSVSRVVLVAFPLIVLLAAVGGYRISRRAFQPVEQMNRTVSEINEGSDLSRRIEIGQGKDEIHRLADNFNSMFSRLESSFDAQMQFTADASHELRTPTAVIMAQCELALDSPADAEEYRQALLLIQRQGGKMADIINQLLDITRLEQRAQDIERKHTDISALVGAVCDDFIQSGVQLQTYIEQGVEANVDKGLIGRMLNNLIHNAVKYGGDEIRVSLTRQGGAIRFEVADNGPGIAPEHRDKIWRRFYQANPSRGGSAAAQGGAGLGLAMVRQIAGLHGGTAELAESEGSRFVITIPCENP